MSVMSTLTQPETVVAAKAEFDRAVDRMKRALATTPDDKLNWSPGGEARTPLMQVAHVSAAIEGMVGWFQGQAMDWSDIKAIDAGWRAAEKKVQTREQAETMLEAARAKYHAYLDSLTEEQLAKDFPLPFGPRPMSDVITFPADHTRGHAAQLEYTQTCYGDVDWHMG